MEIRQETSRETAQPIRSLEERVVFSMVEVMLASARRAMNQNKESFRN